MAKKGSKAKPQKSKQKKGANPPDKPRLPRKGKTGRRRK